MKNTTKLNWLFKLTLHTLVCWSLTIWQITPQVMAADDVLSSGATTVNPQSGTTSTSTGGLVQTTPDESTGSGVTKVEGSDLKAASRFFFSNLALFFAGFMGPTLVKQCPNSWSVRVFAVSAALYVANEIGLFTRFNSAIKKEMVAYLGRGDEDRQIQSLESAANQTRKAKEAAKRRALIAKIAAAGFGVSAAIAMAEAAQVWNMTPDCTPMASGSIQQNRGIPLRMYSNTGPIYNTQRLQIPMAFNDNSFSELMGPQNDSIKVITGKALKKDGLLSKFLSTIIPSTYAQENVGSSKDAKIKESKDGEKTIIVNSVGAKLAATGLGVVGGLAVMNMKTSGLGDVFKKIVETKYARPVGFSIFSVVALGASKESADSANLLEKRAQEYDKLANSLRQRVDQSIDTQTGDGEFINQTVQEFDNSNSGGIGNNEMCFTGGAASGLTADTNCSCRSSNTCAGPQVPSTTSLPSFTGSTLLADNINGLKGASADLFAGRLKGATTKGQSLTNGAAKITRLRDALKKKINEDRLKAGSKPIDFESAEKQIAGTMERQVESAFNNLSPREQQALSRLGSGFGTGADGDDKDKKKEELAESGNSGKSKVIAADINPNAGKASNKTADGAVWDFNFEDDAAKGAAEQAAIAAALAEDEVDDYKIEGDINDDRNKNLFNIITRRYLKSVYPVIFEEQ